MDKFVRCREEPWCVLQMGHFGDCEVRQNTGGIRDPKDRVIGFGVFEPDAIKQARKEAATTDNARLAVLLTDVVSAYDDVVAALVQKSEGEEQAIANHTALIDSLSAIAATAAAKRVSRTIKEG